MRICTTEQSRNIDRLTIEKYGIAGDFLWKMPVVRWRLLWRAALNFDKTARDSALR
jgi:hypothetical protein